MVWSWSHSHEAYANAHDNLCELPLETLRVIEAEWRASKYDGWQVNFSKWHYDRAVRAIERENSSTEELAQVIWEQASEQATCDNGGYNAWMCPFGCHTVPFDREV